MAVRYSVGDQLGLTDINGQFRRLEIKSLAQYDVAKQLGNIEVLAQQYPSPHDVIDPDNTTFYICASLPEDMPAFSNVILWDDIIDHGNTSYITKTSVWRMVILPVPVTAGIPVRPIETIMSDIKSAIADKVPDAVINYEDITESEENILIVMEKACGIALRTIDEFKTLEAVRPLIGQLASIDFNKLTTDITSSLTSIQARLAVLDNGSI
jgi:hypothetical protein